MLGGTIEFAMNFAVTHGVSPAAAKGGLSIAQ
jgi:hypothetical protein